MRWFVQWFETDGNGMRHRRSKAFKTLTEAQRYATAVSDDQYSGRYVNVADQVRTFGAAAKEWRAAQHDVGYSTGKRYDDMLRTHIYPRWKDTALKDIDETSINQWVQALRDGTAPYAFKNKRKPKPASVKHLALMVDSVFGAVLRYATRRGWMRTNPMDSIRLPKRDNDPDHEERLKVFLTYEEVEALADAASTERDSLLIRVMAYTGVRSGEAFALRVCDIDLDARRMSVSRTLTRGEGGWTIGLTKGRKTRKVAIPVFLVDMLRSYMSGRDGDELLFPDSNGGTITPGNWHAAVFDKAAEGAGLSEIAGLRPHSLRHTYASLAIAAGCDVRTLANALGHTDVSITLNEYSGLWPDRLDEVSDALDRERAARIS